MRLLLIALFAITHEALACPFTAAFDHWGKTSAGEPLSLLVLVDGRDSGLRQVFKFETDPSTSPPQKRIRHFATHALVSMTDSKRDVTFMDGPVELARVGFRAADEWRCQEGEARRSGEGPALAGEGTLPGRETLQERLFIDGEGNLVLEQTLQVRNRKPHITMVTFKPRRGSIGAN